MINSLFSSFDPIRSFIKANLLVVFFIPLIQKILTINSRITNTIYLLISLIKSEINATSNNTNKYGKRIILIRFFLIIISLNLFGITPYVYTMTAQLVFAISIRLPIWLIFIIFSRFYNTKHIIRHLVPVSTPIFLSQFMVLIETVSQIIRPITLSVRLAANLTAGHILMGLVTNTITIFNPIVIILLILILLELAVAVIQAYVFTILLSIYSAETYDKTISSLSYCFY